MDAKLPKGVSVSETQVGPFGSRQEVFAQIDDRPEEAEEPHKVLERYRRALDAVCEAVLCADLSFDKRTREQLVAATLMQVQRDNATLDGVWKALHERGLVEKISDLGRLDEVLARPSLPQCTKAVQGTVRRCKMSDGHAGDCA